jgi:hypothetical protein
MLDFKKFFQEEMLPGSHNDGNRLGTMPAIVGSDWSGSESFPSNLPKFDSPELVFPELPEKTIHGQIIRIIPNRERYSVDIDVGEGKINRVELYHDALKKWIIGKWNTIDDLIKKNITLHCQGYDKNGNPHIKYAELN